MGINRIFKREAQRQIKEGIKRKANGEKDIVLPFILRPDPSKYIHPRHKRGLIAFLKKYPGIGRDIMECGEVLNDPMR